MTESIFLFIPVLQVREVIFFVSFLVFVLFVLLLDLGVFTRSNHVIHFKEAIAWTSVWVACAFGFYFFLRHHGEMVHGITDIDHLRYIIEKYRHPIETAGKDFATLVAEYNRNLSIEYLTGYFIEYALSVDNIFVILLIFSTFGVRERYYKRVLFWGVLGAVVMRFVFIFLGAALIQRFAWILFVFGGFLIYSGVKLLIKGDKEETFDEKNHPVVKLTGKVFRVFPRYIGQRFFIRKDRHLYVTPLFIVLMVTEFSDLIFAIDSVPAIFVVTKDPFVVFFSNIFAIMGLRSMFFVLNNVMHYFHYLKYGLAILLIFIGVKMIFHHYLEGLGFTNQTSLYIVAGILAGSILISLLFPAKKKETI